MPDLELILTKDDRVVRIMAPDELNNLSEAVLSRLQEVARQIKERLVRELRRELRQDFNDRPRNGAYDNNTTQIIHHIEKALGDSKVVKEGDTIVTGGQMKLRNGVPVSVDNSVVPKNDANPLPVDQ